MTSMLSPLNPMTWMTARRPSRDRTPTKQVERSPPVSYCRRLPASRIVSLPPEAIAEAARGFDRAAALDSLGIIGRREHVPLVVGQLKADDAYVRLCAAEALDRMGTRAAVSAVAAVENDPDMRVRLQAAKCLAAHG